MPYLLRVFDPVKGTKEIELAAGKELIGSGQ
jgi:hypothetical protein